MTHHLTTEVERAIDHAISRLVDDVLWHLSDEELDRDRVEEILAECQGSDTAAIGLTLDQKLEAIEHGADELGLEDLTFKLESLRSDLESQAAMFIHMLAESRARDLFEDLFDFMEENDLEPEQMRDANPLGWMAHRSERDETPYCTVYEYRDVEDLGRHLDVWEYRMTSGETIWLAGDAAMG